MSGTLLDREVLSVPRSRPADAPFRILYVGYLRREKGVDALLAACSQLAQRGLHFELSNFAAKELEDLGVTDYISAQFISLSDRVNA